MREEALRSVLLVKAIEATGRPVETLVIQRDGGTQATIAAGRAAVERIAERIDDVPMVPMKVSELVVGTVCGGSDATSGLTANPAIGRAFDRLLQQGATAIFEETGIRVYSRAMSGLMDFNRLFRYEALKERVAAFL